MGNKTKRLVTYEGGYFVKVSNLEKTVGQNDKAFVRSLTKRTGFRFMNGVSSEASKGKDGMHQVTLLGDVSYPIDVSTENWDTKSVNEYAIFSSFSETGETEGWSILEQTGGVCHAVESYNNDQGSTGNNGYTYSYTTKAPDYHKGASPMKIVGLTLRVWCSRMTSEYSYNNDKIADRGQEAYTSDCFINKMHALYIKPNGQKYSEELLPEGNNTGKYQFYRKDKLSDYYTDLDQHRENAFLSNKNPNSAKKIRVWHKRRIPTGDCFIGFHINWGIGKIKNKNAYHNLFFGGVAPILETDLDFIVGNNPEHEPPHTAVYMNYLEDQKDLYNYYPELDPDDPGNVEARKLWTVSDANHDNKHGTNKNNYGSRTGFYQQSFSKKAGNMDLPDL